MRRSRQKAFSSPARILVAVPPTRGLSAGQETHAVKSCLALFALALLSVSFTLPANAQDLLSDNDGGHEAKVFAEFSGAHSGQGTGYLWGGSAGGYLQGHLLGVVLRGTAEPSGATVHVFNVVCGPRLAVDLPVFRLYVEAAGGMGHAGYYDTYGNFGSSWGPAWQADAGVSHGLLSRLDWRVLEVAYGRIYAGPGVSPVIISTGLSLHLWGSGVQ